MSMHSTAAEDAAYFRQHIPRHPDELASTDVWEHACPHCPVTVQGGLIALALHYSIVHADLAEAEKAQRRRESKERARQRARERYRERRDRQAAAAPQIPTQPIRLDIPEPPPPDPDMPTVGWPATSVQEALFDLDPKEPAR